MTYLSAWRGEGISDAMLATNFPHLARSNHFREISESFALVEQEIRSKTVIDLGCGKAELADCLPDYDYCGADLPGIIENVSKKVRPTLKYIGFDATDSDMEFISDYDVVVMNSFLSELADADVVLAKVLKNAKDYVIIHRQYVKQQSGTTEYFTYGGLTTTRYFFSREKLDEIISDNNCRQILDLTSQADMGQTITIRKDKE